MPVVLITLIILIVAFIDVSNLDNILYLTVCSILKSSSCTGYYDLPIWEVATSVGSIGAIYFAYLAIIQSNKQLEIEQSPYVVMNDRIITNAKNVLHNISLKNIGKGMAKSIISTADPEGKISIIEGSNPHSIDLGSNQPYTTWAIDEGKVIKGLNKQGKKNR